MNKIDKKRLSFFKLEPGHIPELLHLENIIFPCPWNEKMFKHELHSEYSRFCVLVDEQTHIYGYFGLWIVQDEGHINNFAVVPEYQRQGLGDMMIKEIFEIGKKHKISLYYLEVRKSNEPAIQLYKKHGFFEAGIRRNYYSHPMEDALLMTKIINL